MRRLPPRAMPTATAQSLAASVGAGDVTVRTVYRDLHALEAAGFPLYTDRDDDGLVRWRLLRKGVTPARSAA